MKSKYNINLNNLFAKVEMEKGEIWMDNDYKIHEVPKTGRTHEEGGELAMIENLYGLLSVNMVLSNSKRLKDELSNQLKIDGKTLSDYFRNIVDEDSKKQSKLVKAININKIRLFDLIAQETVTLNTKHLSDIPSQEDRFINIFHKQEETKQEFEFKSKMKYGGKNIYRDGGLIPQNRIKEDFDLNYRINQLMNRSKSILDFINNNLEDLLELEVKALRPIKELFLLLYILVNLIEFKNTLDKFKPKDLKSLSSDEKKKFDIRDLQKYLLENIKKVLLTNSDLLLTKLALANALVRELEFYNLSDSRYVNLKNQNVLLQLERNNQDYYAALQSLLNNLIGYANAANLFGQKISMNAQLIGNNQNVNNEIDNKQELMNTEIYNRQSLSDQQARGIFNENVQKSKSNQMAQLLELNDSISSMKKQNELFNNNFELTQRMFPNFDTRGRFKGDNYLIINSLMAQGLTEEQAMTVATRIKTENSNGTSSVKEISKLTIQEKAKNDKAMKQIQLFYLVFKFMGK